MKQPNKTILKSAKRALNAVLKVFGQKLMSNNLLYDWQRNPKTKSSFRKHPLPGNAEQYLRPDNPVLEKLQQRYASFDGDATVPLVWKDGIVTPDDLRYFRGDNAYVWQLRGTNMNPMAYALTAYYVESIDKLGLLEQLGEDENFGNYTFVVNNRLISRDLLDSITEIYFLEKHLGISSWDDLTLLDIGAGYGRLAHRMIEAFPNIDTYFCADAVATSTFLSSYYLEFREVNNRARVVPLDEIESTLENQHIDIAINIHSFSECRMPAIEWWVSLMAKYRIKYFMVVPNDTDNNGERLLTTDQQDFRPIFEKYGYQLKVREPKYEDQIVQRYAINPTYHAENLAYLYLFELH
jgi:hypothetical protein